MPRTPRRIRTPKYTLDYSDGSIRKGWVTMVGTKQVMAAERESASCWRIAFQSRQNYDANYLAFHGGRCHKPADVKRIMGWWK